MLAHLLNNIREVKINLEVLLVKGIKHNLLRISQSCDEGNNVNFDLSGCREIKSKLNETLFMSSKVEIYLYRKFK